MDSTTSAAESLSSRISQILQPRYDSASPIWRSPSTRDETISCFATLLCDLVETLQPSTDSETKKIFHPTASESMSDSDSKQAKDGPSALCVGVDVPHDVGSGGVDAATSVSVPPASHDTEQESQAHERNRGKIHPATIFSQGAKAQGNTESGQFSIFLSQLSTSASKMAKFMAKQDADAVNNANDEDDRQSKDKLTVADIAARCINLLTGDGIASDSSKKICSELYNVYIECIFSRSEEDSEQKPAKLVEVNESFFIRCMISSLKGVQFASTAYVEDISDFDFLWKWLMDCPSLTAFFPPDKNKTSLRSENADLSAVPKKRSSPDWDASLSQQDEISSLQDFSWVLSCLMKRFRQLHLISENEDICSQAPGRRDRVLSIASSMVIVMKPSIDLRECHHFTKTTKRRRLDNESTSEIKTPKISQSPPAEKTDSRTIDEGEAIAALSMMISGPDNCEGSPRSVSLGSTNTAPAGPVVLDHVLSTSQDLVNLMICAGNELLSRILGTETHHAPFTHEELEREIEDTTKTFLSEFSDHLVLQQQPSSKTMSYSVQSSNVIPVKAGSNNLVGDPGETNADCQMNSASETLETTTDYSQYSELSNSTKVNSEGESVTKPVESDKVKALLMEPDIKSYVETHQSRMVNLPFLKKLYGKVVSDLTAESGTTTTQKESSIISILGSFPYVDEMFFFNRDSLVLSFLSTSAADLPSVGKASGSLALICQYRKATEINSDVVSVDPSPDVNDTSHSHLPSSKQWESDSMVMHDFDGTDLVTSSESHFLSSNHANMMSPRPVLTEAMELTEWTASILEFETIKPSSRLLAYLELSDTEPAAAKTSTAVSVIPRRGWRSVLIPAVNRATFRIKESIVQHDSSLGTSGQCLCSETGEMMDDVHNSLLEPETSTSLPKHVTRLCKSLVALYYHALEAILSNETKRRRSSSHAQILHNEEYHRALLTVCYLCLLKVLGGDVGDKSEMYSIGDVHSVLKLMECSPFLFLKVSEPFTRALQACDRRHESVVGQKHMYSLLNDPLPRLLQKHVRNSEVMIVDSLIWLQNNGIDGNCELSRLIDEVYEEENHEEESMSETAWPPKCLRLALPGEKEDMEVDEYKTPFESRNPEYPYLNFLLQKMQIVWSYRISFLCHALKIPNEYPVTNQIWLKFRWLLRHHIHLFIDHHVDQLILCTIYSVCRIMKMEPALSFSTITNVYMSLREEELGKNAAIRVIHHIKIPIKTDSINAKGYGNVVQFYNDVYVPAVGKHLMMSQALKRAGIELGDIMASGGGDNESTPQPQQLINGFEDSRTVARSESDVVRVGSSNIYMKVPGHFQNNTVTARETNKGKESSKTAQARWDILSPKIRASYNFGEPSVKRLALVNKVAQSSNSSS